MNGPLERIVLSLYAVLVSGLASTGGVVESDICVYGGTSGGAVAAVQAARMGKRVILLEPGNHIGGMTSGGLGATDTGNPASIGGLAREFYRRVGSVYGQPECFEFEPHVAEQVLLDMLKESRVPVRFGQQLRSVTKRGRRVVDLRMEDGDSVRAKMFIDASYEGDLMARSGVRYVVGRESAMEYGESLNGVRPPLNEWTDPFRIPGRASSGVLPLVDSKEGGLPGDGDKHVQAYNYRLCLTQDPTNRLPILPPSDYKESRYELLGRYVDLRLTATNNLRLGKDFLSFVALPNGKADVNAGWGISTDFAGANDAYSDGGQRVRARICREHEDYIRGLLHYLATSARVPANVRREMQSWGLCKDEFQDSGGWPHQLYVREARRMVSDYVMTQANAEGRVTAADSIALASYAMDSHIVRRFVKDGRHMAEGNFYERVPKPYPISYRSIVPGSNDCENLFVTFCLSATHVVFASCRMEPVFMMTGQAAATGAGLAIDEGVAAQEVDIQRIQQRLTADHQIIRWNDSFPSGIARQGPISPPGVVDNMDSTGAVVISGHWDHSTSSAGYYGADYLHDAGTGKGEKTVVFIPDLKAAGPYEVYLRWTSALNRATNTPVDVVFATGTDTILVNQRTHGGEWVRIGTYDFEKGRAGRVVIRTDNTASNYVVADAVWFRAPGDPSDHPVEASSNASPNVQSPAQR